MRRTDARASPARPYVARPHTVAVSAGKFEREFEHASSPRDRLRAQYAPSSARADATNDADAHASVDAALKHLEALAETIEACDAIGAHAVGRIAKKMMDAESFAAGARDTTNAPLSRMGAGASRGSKNSVEKDAIHEALAHLSQWRLDQEAG